MHGQWGIKNQTWLMAMMVCYWITCPIMITTAYWEIFEEKILLFSRIFLQPQKFNYTNSLWSVRNYWYCTCTVVLENLFAKTSKASHPWKYFVPWKFPNIRYALRFLFVNSMPHINNPIAIQSCTISEIYTCFDSLLIIMLFNKCINNLTNAF